jgi:hypothetical protein
VSSPITAEKKFPAAITKWPLPRLYVCKRSGVEIMKTIIGGLIIGLALALAPAPRVAVENPKALYLAAMYKTAVGDTDSALRLLHPAEQARDRQARAEESSLRRTQASVRHAAAVRSAILTIL